MCDIGCTEAKKKPTKKQHNKTRKQRRGRDKGRDLRRDGARRKNKRGRERSKQRRERQSGSEDEESRCSLHPPATSLILAVKRAKNTRRRNHTQKEKKEKGKGNKKIKHEEDVHYQTTLLLLLSLRFTLFSFIISPPRATISLKAGLQIAPGNRSHRRRTTLPKATWRPAGSADDELTDLQTDLTFNQN